MNSLVLQLYTSEFFYFTKLWFLDLQDDKDRQDIDLDYKIRTNELFNYKSNATSRHSLGRITNIISTSVRNFSQLKDRNFNTNASDMNKSTNVSSPPRKLKSIKRSKKYAVNAKLGNMTPVCLYLKICHFI